MTLLWFLLNWFYQKSGNVQNFLAPPENVDYFEFGEKTNIQIFNDPKLWKIWSTVEILFVIVLYVVVVVVFIEFYYYLYSSCCILLWLLHMLNTYLSLLEVTVQFVWCGAQGHFHVQHNYSWSWVGTVTIVIIDFFLSIFNLLQWQVLNFTAEKAN